MYSFQQKRAISKKIASSEHIDTYRQLLASRGLPAAGIIMKDRQALAVSLVYTLLEHFTEEEIITACKPDDRQPVIQSVLTPVSPPTKPEKKKVSKHEQYPNIQWNDLDNPLIRMADSIFSDRINCWARLKVLEAETQEETAAKEDIEEYIRLTIRMELCFSELRHFNDSGAFLGKHPFISAKDERTRIMETLRTSPDTYFQERKNIELNISRYSSQLNSKTVSKEKKDKARENLEKHQATLQLYKDIFNEFVCQKS
ncbi:MAG: hypothetical protein J6J25_04435 [Bacteroidales bacterium]|nr:hypothetical protein [Bacteroidales bacterium]